MATNTTTTFTLSAQAAFATIDLSGYDAEQSRLMDERCIVVDEQDRPIGALDKKTCTQWKRALTIDWSHLGIDRSPYGEHPEGSLASRVLRLRLPSVRREAPAAAARF
jgi:hypothetical protein